MTKQHKICAIEGCNKLVLKRNSKYCGKSCRTKAAWITRREKSPKNYTQQRHCTYCENKKIVNNFRIVGKEKKRSTICFDCEKVIDKKRKEWGKIALQPVRGERYHCSASRKTTQISSSQDLIAELASCIHPFYFRVLKRNTGRNNKPVALDFGTSLTLTALVK